MKISKTARLCAACAAALLALGGCSFVEKINALVIEDVRPERVRDGSYEASVRILPVTASVRVTVSGGKITAIALLSHSHGPDHGADAILPRIVEAQSLQVDAVSGSTYSSKVVRKAVELALKKGL
jgi:uncharacterized protein with FMN-binding domain